MAGRRKGVSVTAASFEQRFQDRLRLYEQDFDLSTLNQSSDKGLLDALIRQELLLENLQQSLQDITIDDTIDLLDKMSDIKKFSDLIRDATASVTTLQKTLSIDRKTRRNDNVTSIADYIKQIKREAEVFIDKRLQKIYCPNCKVMVGRFAPVHKHTAFKVAVECSQCNKMIIAHREASDIWVDVKDADWRRKYHAEIIQPVKKNNFRQLDIPERDDSVVIRVQDKDVHEPPMFTTEGELEQQPIKRIGLQDDVALHIHSNITEVTEATENTEDT